MAYLSSGKKKLLGSNTEGKSINIWQPNTEYKLNDLCLYKETNYYSVYICVTEHTSADAFVSAYWETIDGTEFEGYSTEEQVIGTWIDGKPLYRRVIVDTTKSEIDLSSINIDYINLSKSVFIVHGITVSNYTNGNDYAYTVYDSNTKILTTVTGGNATSLLSKTIYILEYTKTTD